MPNKTNFLIYSRNSNWNNRYQLRIFCNDMLVDEVVIENGDESVFVKTKSMYHEDGNFHYKFDFTVLTEAKENGSGNDSHEDSYIPLILWHVLHNDHPMSFYVDTLNYTDVGWLKNRLWTNNKAHIYPGQPMTMNLNFRGGNVAMDNQFQLKNIKELHKVKFDMFGESDDAQLGNLPKDETKYVAMLDENKDLSIKKYDGEPNMIGQFTLTNESTDGRVSSHHLHHFMHFVDQSCMAVHLKHSVPEYYSEYKI